MAEPRSGAPRRVDDARIEAVIVRTLENCPENATYWSSRGMAKASGLSVSTVQRVWRAFGLQPHRMETFKLSTDPKFVAKVRDVVGLYVSPPQHAVVLSVDDKSQIQALDSSQPMLPMRPGHRPDGAMTIKGMTPRRCSPPSILRPDGSSASATDARAAEFRSFLDEIEAAVPHGLDVHLVMDNYATHRTPMSGDG